MAFCYTMPWGNSYAPIVRLTVTETSSNDTTVTLSYTFQYSADYAASTNGKARAYSIVIDGVTVKTGSFNIDGVIGTRTLATGTVDVGKTTAARSVDFSCSFDFNISWNGTYSGTRTASDSISIGAKTSYRISYDANGGTGTPSSQTKWHDTNLTLSTTKPTKTGYNFIGWSTSSTDKTVEYSAGATYTDNANITLYAVWSTVAYTVSYDANGGTGAPSSQIKNHDVDLTLSTTIPTRDKYNFQGWGTTATSKTVEYAVGAAYTDNASITLYAIWELGYTNPRISYYAITRCNSSGIYDEKGNYIRVRFEWATDNDVTSIYIYHKSSTATSWTNISLSASGTSGSVDRLLSNVDLETSHSVYVTVSDSGGTTTSPTYTISGQIYPIDVLVGGIGVAIGKAAETENLFEVDWPSKFNHIVNFKSGLYVNNTPVSLDGHEHSKYALANHTHSEYLQKTGGEITGYLQVDNQYAAISFIRFAGEWIGFYSSTDNANNGNSRKGYMGHDGSTNFYINNAAGGSNYVNKAWTVSSDERLKTSVEDLPEIFIDIWKELSPKLFKWNELNPDEGKFQFGLIAQEVIEIFGKYDLDYKEYNIVSPYKIQGDDTEYFGVTYDNYQMMTALVVKKQQEEIDILKDEVAELKKMVQQLLTV